MAHIRRDHKLTTTIYAVVHNGDIGRIFTKKAAATGYATTCMNRNRNYGQGEYIVLEGKVSYKTLEGLEFEIQEE